jgi:hypothetical protein
MEARVRAGADRGFRVPRRRLAAVCSLLLFGVAVPPAAGASFPGIPTIPSVPNIKVHLPKPQQSASFDVIVEGKATSKLTSQLSGHTGTCLYSEDGTVDSTTSYLRGRGVVLRFDRYGSEVLIHRAGRETDSSLAVTVATKRTAEGGSHAEPANPPLPCAVPPYQLTQNPDCGQTFDEPASMVLSWEVGSLGLRIGRNGALGGGGGLDDKCGLDPQTGFPAQFEKEWPNAPGLLHGGYLPAHRIFGRAHALVVKLSSSIAREPAVSTRHVGEGLPIGGTLVESASNEATIRLVRRKHG